jgi:hypothetical protein
MATQTQQPKRADLTKILVAISGNPKRNPSSATAAMGAIGREADRLGLTNDQIFTAAPELLNGKIQPEGFVAFAATQGNPPQVEAPKRRRHAPAAAAAKTVPEADSTPKAAIKAAAANGEAKTIKPPRPGTKTAIMIEMLTTDGGATVPMMAQRLGWNPAMVRSYINETMRRRRGLNVETIRETGQDTTYRIMQEGA